MTESDSQPTVIRTEGTVPLDPQAAFSLFADDMNSWWPSEVHTLPSETCTILVEPRVDGRWFERSPTGEEADWGKVTAYEPGSRLVLLWQLMPDAGYDPDVDEHPMVNFDPELITELELTFSAADEGGTTVALEHRKLDNLGDNDAADLIRDYLAEGDLAWSATFQKYLEAARQSA